MTDLENLDGSRTESIPLKWKYLHPSVPRSCVMKRLKQLVTVWRLVEEATGHRWRLTSFIRHSPNHQFASAIDIAPSIAEDSEQYYAVSKSSDPVLYKRIPMIRALQTVCKEWNHSYAVGIYIENHHLHLQLFDHPGPLCQLYKWKGPAKGYPDTFLRMKLPMTSTGYELV